MSKRFIFIVRCFVSAYIVLALFWLAMGWPPIHLD